MRWTAERLRIWADMSPADRDYDRVVAGSYPPGQWEPETPEWKAKLKEMRADPENPDDHSCTCWINGPCGHCESCPVCNCERCDDWHQTNEGEVCPKLTEETS